MLRKRLLVVMAMVPVLLLAGTVKAQYDFNGCGSLAVDIEGGCILFQPYSGGSFTLDNYGGFGPGDVVRVVGDFGTIADPCSWCGTFQFPCIHNISISECEEPVSCCQENVGDANGLGGNEPTIGDISVMIEAKFITGSCDGIIVCLLEADVNQSGGCNPTCNDITIGDISFVIDYLFILSMPGQELPACLVCP